MMKSQQSSTDQSEAQFVSIDPPRPQKQQRRKFDYNLQN